MLGLRCWAGNGRRVIRDVTETEDVDDAPEFEDFEGEKKARSVADRDGDESIASNGAGSSDKGTTIQRTQLSSVAVSSHEHILSTTSTQVYVYRLKDIRNCPSQLSDLFTFAVLPT